MMNPFHTILNPKSIAVIGASRSPGKVGYQVLKNIIQGGYTGKIYPINPSASVIQKIKAYPSLEALPQAVDLAIIITPAPLVSAIIDSCIATKAKAVIIITAGFAESGPKGRLLQASIAEKIAKENLTVLGPNCLGCFSAVHHINATFGPNLPQNGDVMLISQSGAMVTGVLDWAKKMELGLSHAVTLGNRVALGENEALAFAHEDPNTQVIMVYLESFQQAATFFSLASRVSLKKPILLLKGGQTSAGQAASASHTAALATDYVLIQAFAKQTGVILCSDVSEWLQTAAAFSQAKPMNGQDLAIITNAGGPGVISSDLATGQNLRVSPLSRNTKQYLKHALEKIAPHNPLDVLGDALPEHFAASLKAVSVDTIQDGIMVIVTPQTTTAPKEVAQVIVSESKKSKKPIFVVLLGGEKLEPARKILEAAHIPTYTYPGEAIQTISTISAYYAHKNQNLIFPPPALNYISAAQKQTLERELALPLTLETAFKVLTAYKCRLPKYQIISHHHLIPSALSEVGRPAVLKTAAMTLAHKATKGGVVLNVMTGHQARIAVTKLQKLHSQVLFQQTIQGKLEVIIGAKRDPQLGTFMTVGLGGSLTNTLEDREYVFIPAQVSLLKKVFNRTKAGKALAHMGISDEPLIDLLGKISGIMVDFPTITEMEINPVIITNTAVFCCDIKIQVHQV